MISGGGAGRWIGPGKVYVMKDVTGQRRDGCKHNVQMLKIGYSRDPERRLEAIKRELSPNMIELLDSFPADESNRAETAAQNAAKEQLGFVKDNGPGARGNATDWFRNPKRKTHDEIVETIRQAVHNHNYTNGRYEDSY